MSVPSFNQRVTKRSTCLYQKRPRPRRRIANLQVKDLFWPRRLPVLASQAVKHRLERSLDDRPGKFSWRVVGA